MVEYNKIKLRMILSGNNAQSFVKITLTQDHSFLDTGCFSSQIRRRIPNGAVKDVNCHHLPRPCPGQSDRQDPRSCPQFQDPLSFEILFPRLDEIDELGSMLFIRRERPL